MLFASITWTKGLVGPKNPQGDSQCQSFEVVGDPTHALAYCSEYVSKDIDFVDSVQGCTTLRQRS